MKMRILFGLLICTGTGAVACGPAASEQELQEMCTNLVVVRGEVKVPDEVAETAAIEEEYAKKRKHLLDWKAREMKSWDDELESKIKKLEADAEEAKGPAKPKPEDLETEKAALQKEYAAKKKIGSDKFDEDLKLLVPAEKDAINALRKKIESKQDAIRDAERECLDAAKKEKVSSKVAQCRIQAKSPDEYWNVCK